MGTVDFIKADNRVGFYELFTLCGGRMGLEGRAMNNLYAGQSLPRGIPEREIKVRLRHSLPCGILKTEINS
jgi:hypothetical protein